MPLRKRTASKLGINQESRVMVHLETDARDAFARICAHVCAQGPIGEVADDSMAGRVRLLSD